MRMRVKLPVIYCPDCRRQLVNHIYHDLRKDDLLCIWCAKKRPKGTVSAINSMDPVDAIALLVRHGATIQ